MAMHSTDIESGLIFSQKKMDTTGTQPVHTTQGILDAVAEYAPTHIVPMAATTDYAELRAAVEIVAGIFHERRQSQQPSSGR